MSFHLAAARRGRISALGRALSPREIPPPANDDATGADDDRLLHAALRHFAQHGLGAVREAQRAAEEAFFAGDRARYDWWRGICRTLDRRTARVLERIAD